MEQYYVGLDVHSRQSTFVIEDGAGQVIARGEVPTTPAALDTLRTAHHLPPGTPGALETGTVAFFVARQRAALGLAPQVIDAHEVRLKAHRPTQQSDRRDAFERCEGLRGGISRAIVHVPRPEVSRLRETLARRRHFVRLQSAQVTAVKALLRAAGLGYLSRSLGSELGWAKVLATLAEHGALRAYVEQHRALWRCAREQIATPRGQGEPPERILQTTNQPVFMGDRTSDLGRWGGRPTSTLALAPTSPARAAGIG